MKNINEDVKRYKDTKQKLSDIAQLQNDKTENILVNFYDILFIFLF